MLIQIHKNQKLIEFFSVGLGQKSVWSPFVIRPWKPIDQVRRDVQNLWGIPDFLGAHILLKKKKNCICKFPVE